MVLLDLLAVLRHERNVAASVDLDAKLLQLLEVQRAQRLGLFASFLELVDNVLKPGAPRRVAEPRVVGEHVAGGAAAAFRDDDARGPRNPGDSDDVARLTSITSVDQLEAVRRDVGDLHAVRRRRFRSARRLGVERGEAARRCGVLQRRRGAAAQPQRDQAHRGRGAP